MITAFGDVNVPTDTGTRLAVNVVVAIVGGIVGDGAYIIPVVYRIVCNAEFTYAQVFT